MFSRTDRSIGARWYRVRLSTPRPTGTSARATQRVITPAMRLANARTSDSDHPRPVQTLITVSTTVVTTT
ncbi:hypothetical protein ES5_13348 [Dietzia cinnamea P4]|nr:hypothetical protein ES5_13348 [Dietzia cinnamea P4]